MESVSDMAFIKPKVKTQKQWLIVALLFIVIVFLSLGELNNRINYAENTLTENDYIICLDEIDSVNYIDCWTYLKETDKKDMSAIWEGV